MDLSQLRLKRFVAANFKSLKRIELDNLQNLALFMGRNNAGKSNILDCFKFLSDAVVSFDFALQPRGGALREVFFRKKGGPIEFTLDFELGAEKREQLIRVLFADNELTTPEAVIQSNFLSIVTLKISIDDGCFSEELTTTNTRLGNASCLIFALKGTPQKTETKAGWLEDLCARCSGKLDSDALTVHVSPPEAIPFRLYLGRHEGAAAFPVSYELAELVHQQFESLEWVDALRRLPPSALIQGKMNLAPDASNLPDVLHWLHNNKPKQFRQIEAEISKLVPQLGRLYTPTIENAASLGLMDYQDEDLVFSMNQMSVGTRSLAAIITKVVLAPPGAWVCIEEPETYLHPKAQVGLFHFLRQESKSKRIFVATHSTAIAASCPLDSLYIVQRDESDYSTNVTPVGEIDALNVIEQLGVKPSFSFEADAVVFVEDAESAPIYEAWARKFGFKITLQFLDAEGASTLHYFANARVARSKFVHTLVFAIFTSSPQWDTVDTRERLTQHLDLPPHQVFELQADELELHLLDPKAVLKAFPAVTLSETELQCRFSAATEQSSPKKTLRDLLQEFNVGEYNGDLGARIAESMEAIPAPIAEFFDKIALAAKPFWKI